jgi:ribosomal protein S4E
LTGDEVLVVTGGSNGGDSGEIEKVQWIEQVKEAAAAVEELDPRDRKTPIKT